MFKGPYCYGGATTGLSVSQMGQPSDSCAHAHLAFIHEDAV